MREQIWAPWRMSYVTSAKEDGGGCFLCRYRDSSDDEADLVVARDDSTLVVLNRFPYNNGHLLVAPQSHKGEFGELTDDEMLGCMRQVRRMIGLLGELMTPDGFNVGLNLGRAAGAGLPGHLHWHIVPRWSGDTNFMPILADVDVIPQSLESLYAMLTQRLRQGDQ